VDCRVIGWLPEWLAVTVTDEAQAADGGTWYRVERGWVNGKYVCEE
jgi:hypothetical protein